MINAPGQQYGCLSIGLHWLGDFSFDNNNPEAARTSVD